MRRRRADLSKCRKSGRGRPSSMARDSLELLQKLSVVFYEHPYLFAMTLFGVLHIAWLFLLAGDGLLVVGSLLPGI